VGGNIRPILSGQKALVVGIANEHSIAYGCARAFREAGAELAVTWLNDKARPFVEPLRASWKLSSILSARAGESSTPWCIR